MSSFRLTNRVLATIARTSIRSSSVKVASQLSLRFATSATRAFSTAPIRFNAQSNELATILTNELNHEKSADLSFPEDLTAFLNQNKFEVVETAGSALGKIIKKTDSEIIHIYFDVNQVVNLNPEQALEAEEAMELAEEEPESNFINLNVILEKTADNSAVAFDVLLGPEDASAYIENVTAYENVTEALSESAESNHKRELNYNGPEFTNLDEALQTSFEGLLESRGINAELYDFVFGYGIYKENKEYVAWLEKLNKFFKN
ncbi:hypothetical protein WICPIJ_000876 [Wickerhamomyces pijperi]|uniref:Mitochondrial acidic protein MAM33 n=1 Tax=Wickerhamomyces pijperi TaxID=599730 RepID=A0A9P8QF02_WICPI|nr:hypothetical protein WICPIJ_000876 [Wickerhamomyces pijperi]